MLVKFRRGLDDDNAFIDLISPCRTMDCILTNYPPIEFITAENLDVNSQYHNSTVRVGRSTRGFGS